MKGQTIILASPRQRSLAHDLIDKAPDGGVVSISAPRRSLEANAKFWAMLSDISRAKPQGRAMTPERWKAVFLQSFGHAMQFEQDLEGRMFPIGHSSSRLTKGEMSDLIEFMYAYGAQHGVRWSDPTYAG